MSGNRHVGFGGRAGETHRERSRQGAPVRPNRRHHRGPRPARPGRRPHRRGGDRLDQRSPGGVAQGGTPRGHRHVHDLQIGRGHGLAARNRGGRPLPCRPTGQHRPHRGPPARHFHHPGPAGPRRRWRVGDPPAAAARARRPVGAAVRQAVEHPDRPGQAGCGDPHRLDRQRRTAHAVGPGRHPPGAHHHRPSAGEVLHLVRRVRHRRDRRPGRHDRDLVAADRGGRPHRDHQRLGFILHLVRVPKWIVGADGQRGRCRVGAGEGSARADSKGGCCGRRSARRTAGPRSASS